MAAVLNWFQSIFKKKKVITANKGVTARMDFEQEEQLAPTRPHTAISMVAMANIPTQNSNRPRSAPTRTIVKKYPPPTALQRRNSFSIKSDICPCCHRKRQLYKSRGHFRPYILWTDMNRKKVGTVSGSVTIKKKPAKGVRKRDQLESHTMPQINQMEDLSKMYGPGRADSPIQQELLGPYAQFPQYNVPMPGSRDERDSLDSGIELMIAEDSSNSAGSRRHLVSKAKGKKSSKRKWSPIGETRLAWSNKVQGDSPYDTANLLEITRHWPRITRKPKQFPRKPPFRV